MPLLKRIPLDEVTVAAHSLWLNPITADKIAFETIEILNKTYARKFSFFNGKRARCLVGGLFYLLGYRYNEIKRQRELADKLGTSDVSIRVSYRQWLETFPDLFVDVMQKFTQDRELRTYILLTFRENIQSKAR